MHYELKGRHEVCFKVKIRLPVAGKAKNLNSKARKKVLDSLAKTKDLRCP